MKREVDRATLPGDYLSMLWIMVSTPGITQKLQSRKLHNIPMVDIDNLRIQAAATGDLIEEDDNIARNIWAMDIVMRCGGNALLKALKKRGKHSSLRIKRTYLDTYKDDVTGGRLPFRNEILDVEELLKCFEIFSDTLEVRVNGLEEHREHQIDLAEKKGLDTSIKPGDEKRREDIKNKLFRLRNKIRRELWKEYFIQSMDLLILMARTPGLTTEEKTERLGVEKEDILFMNGMVEALAKNEEDITKILDIDAMIRMGRKGKVLKGSPLDMLDNKWLKKIEYLSRLKWRGLKLVKIVNVKYVTNSESRVDTAFWTTIKEINERLKGKKNLGSWEYYLGFLEYLVENPGIPPEEGEYKNLELDEIKKVRRRLETLSARENGIKYILKLDDIMYRGGREVFLHTFRRHPTTVGNSLTRSYRRWKLRNDIKNLPELEELIGEIIKIPDWEWKDLKLPEENIPKSQLEARNSRIRSEFEHQQKHILDLKVRRVDALKKMIEEYAAERLIILKDKEKLGKFRSKQQHRRWRKLNELIKDSGIALEALGVKSEEILEILTDDLDLSRIEKEGEEKSEE